MLSRLKINRLARIEFNYCELSDMLAAELFNALNAMSGLHNLLDLRSEGNAIASEGCAALCALLENSDCRLITLDLFDNSIDDACINNLISGLIACYSLEYLSFGKLKNRLTSIGWKAFSVYLSNPKCLLQKFVLRGFIIRDESAVAALGGSLAMNGTLKYLDFGYNEVTPTAWQGISTSLVSHSSLKELDLSGCNINDEGASDIFLALAEIATLKKLILMYAEGVSSVGWMACFQHLLDSQSALEILNFEHNAIDDEGASALASLLGSHMSTVASLNLNDNDSITTNGWRAFSHVLAPTSTSKLKILRLANRRHEDEHDRIHRCVSQ